MIKRIGEVEIRPIRMASQLADRTIKHPYGVIEDVLVKVDKFLFSVDFVVMDMDEDSEVPLILGRLFMKTTKVMIDVDDGKLTVRVQDAKVNFNMFEAMKHPNDTRECFRVDVLDNVISCSQRLIHWRDGLEKALTEATKEIEEFPDVELSDCLQHLDTSREIPHNHSLLEELKEE